MKAEDIKKIDWRFASLVAINECIMEDDGGKALTIGNYYHPIDIDYYNFTNRLVIYDDMGIYHHFEYETLEEFFEIKLHDYSKKITEEEYEQAKEIVSIYENQLLLKK